MVDDNAIGESSSSDACGSGENGKQIIDFALNDPRHEPCSVSKNWSDAYLNEYIGRSHTFPVRFDAKTSTRRTSLFDSIFADHGSITECIWSCTKEESNVDNDNMLGDANTMSLEAENHLLSQTNPPRAPPKIFLQIPGAIAANEAEINTLAKPDKNGIPSLQVVGGGRAEFRHLGKLFTTVVVKRKTSLKFKGLLCARGDLWRPEVPLEYSAPTVSR